MKKSIIALAILILLLLGGIYNIHYLDKMTGEMITIADEALLLARAGNFPAAAEKAEAAAEYWAAKDGYTHVLIRHTEIDSTTDAFCEMIGALSEGNLQEAIGTHRKLCEHLTSIASMEHITFGSIF